MEPQRLNRELGDRLVAFAWDEWAQMGVSATAKRRSRWAQDPEALIVFTLEIARGEPRLFDEMLDWMLLNEPLLSVRRLRAMCIDDDDHALLDGTLAWLAAQRPRARLTSAAPTRPPSRLTPLFRPAGPARDIDPNFAKAGLVRPPLRPSHKSRPPEPSAAINLAFRMRQILGVGIRAEVVRILLGLAAPHATAQVLAHASAYSRRNVHEALASLSTAGVISVVTIGAERRYTADRDGWAALLHCDPTELAAHRDWRELFAALRRILRFTAQPELRDLSDYLVASRTRDLLELVRPELAFAGIPMNISQNPEETERDLQTLIERLLTALNAPTAASR